jgi:hypothetical protein
VEQPEALFVVLLKKLFMGYLLFSCAGILLIVAAVSASSAWEAVIGGGVFIMIWGSIFLLLQTALFAIRVKPLGRFLKRAAVVSLLNLVIGVPAVAFLIQAASRWAR